MSEMPKQVKVRYAAPPQAGPGVSEAVAYLRNLNQSGVSVSIEAGGQPKLVRDLARSAVPPVGSEIKFGNKDWKPYTAPSDLPEGW